MYSGDRPVEREHGWNINVTRLSYHKKMVKRKTRGLLSIVQRHTCTWNVPVFHYIDYMPLSFPPSFYSKSSIVVFSSWLYFSQYVHHTSTSPSLHVIGLISDRFPLF